MGTVTLLVLVLLTGCAIVLVGGLCVFVVALAPRRRALRSSEECGNPGLRTLRATTQRTRAIALVLAIAAAVGASFVGPLGVGFAVAPAVFASVVVLGCVVSDRVVYRAVRTGGSAELEWRRVVDYLPRALAWASSIGVLALIALLWATTASASPDDMGRPGRSLTRCVADSCRSHGPWPGSFYALPVLIAFTVLALLSAVALVQAVRRPRDGSNSDVATRDDLVRRRVVESVVAAGGFAVFATLAPMAGLSVMGVAGVSEPGGGVLATGLVTLTIAACVGAAWSVVCLLRPGARPPRPRPSSAREARVA